MKKIVYWMIASVVAIQIIRPDFHTIPIDEKMALKAEAEVLSVLHKSCYDCHSQETRYPWYHNIAPLSWVIASHINDGRKALDFSNWENIEPKIKIERLERANRVIHNQMMPKAEYLILHNDAVLSQADKKVLQQFFDSELEKTKSANSDLKCNRCDQEDVA